MVMDNKHLVTTAIAFAGIIAGIMLVNRWISGQMEHMTNNIAIERPATAQPVVPLQQMTQGPKPVFINPTRDPLAPVVPRKDQKSTAKKTAQRQTSPQKIYEPAEANVILVQ